MNQPQLVLPAGTRIVTQSEVRTDIERAPAGGLVGRDVPAVDLRLIGRDGENLRHSELRERGQILSHGSQRDHRRY